MEKTKQQINEEWSNLYDYVKKEIFEYENKNLPKTLVLRLKGLYDGKFMANRYSKPKARYEYTDILMTFKINKINIVKILKTKEFKNEQHKVNYVMAIIENNINDIVEMIERKNKSEVKGEEVKVAISEIDDLKANYNKRTKENTSKILDDLW